MNKNIENEYKPGRFWLLVDGWFRIIEFSVILTTINYFSIINNSLPLKILLVLSFAIYTTWLVEFGDFITEKISTRLNIKKFVKVLTGLIIVIMLSLTWGIILHGTNMFLPHDYPFVIK